MASATARVPAHPAVQPAAQPAARAAEPAAVFVTWDGDPTTTLSVDWHLAPGTDIAALQLRGPGIPRWRTVRGAAVPFPHSTRTVRRARVTGLRPDATYELRIGGAAPWRVRTMPARLTRPVTFAAGGDTQAGDAQFGATNRMVAARDVDFVLLGGDLAYSNGDPRLVRREETWFETVTRTLVTADRRLIPVVAAVGNHEIFSERDTTAATRRMIDSTGVKLGDATYYRVLHAHAAQRQHNAVDVGDYLSLLLLDTDHAGPVDGAQTAWLRDALDRRRAVPHLFPIYHVPGYPSVRAYEGRTSARVREHWAPLFDAAGVRVAFENHDHAYKRTFPIRGNRRDSTGVVYVGDGAWGAGPRPIGRDHKGEPAWYLDRTASVNHGIIVTLDGAAARLEVRDSTGAMIDSLRVTARSVARTASRR